MELFLGFAMIAFITVVSIDIVQQRRQRGFGAKYFEMNESEQ